jgi:hypothetical protein
LNRNKFDPEPAPDKRHEHFRFEFKMARRRSSLTRAPQINQAETTLRIRQGAPRVEGQTQAHGAIGRPARPGHRPCCHHSAAHHEVRPRILTARQKARNVLRRMLSVAIQRHRMAKAQFLQTLKAGLERRPFALSWPQSNAFGPHLTRDSPGCIARAVIHHHHRRQKASDLLQQPWQRQRFVTARNQGGTWIGLVHANIIKPIGGKPTENIAPSFDWL